MSFKERIGGYPVIGRPWRAYGRYGDHMGNRLAAAVTFYGFFSLFPLITLAAAVTAALLSKDQVQRLKNKITEQIPGIADKIDLDALINNAGAVGLIGGVLLLVGGLGWVDATRSSIRALWDRDEEPGNVVRRKLVDTAVLVGLGLTLAFSLGVSTLATAVTKDVAHAVGLEHHSVGRVLLQILAIAIAVAVDVVLFLYLLVGMPRLTMNRGIALRGALLGAVGFEILKILVASYIAKVAGKSMYGAFGVPIALLLWIYFVVRLLLYCAAWTATAQADHDRAVSSDPQAQWRAGDGARSGESGGAGGRPGPDRGTARRRRGRVRGYTAGVLGVAGAGLWLERATRRRTP